MKKHISILLATIMLLSLTACGYQVELKQPQSAAPDSTNPNEMDVTDELIEEIVLHFGAEKTKNHTGSEGIQPYIVSLYYYSGNLTAETMMPGDYFSWQFGYARSLYTEANWDTFVAAHQSPYKENTGLFYPQEEYEANVKKFFDVTTDFLRSDPNYYRAEEKGYWADGGPGKGDIPTITVTDFVQYENYLDIGLDLAYQDGNSPKVLTVKRMEGGYQYLSYINGYVNHEMENSYPEDDTEFRAAALEKGYTERYLDFLREYRRSVNVRDLLNDSELSLQSDFDKEIAVIDRWLAMSPAQLAQEASKTAASSADGKKFVYALFDVDAYLSPDYLIWCNTSTGESRLLSCRSLCQTAQDTDDDLLLVYDHTTLEVFDINTGKKRTDSGPQFNFGRPVSYQMEHVMIGLGYDSAAKYYVAAYGDWLTQNEETNTWEVKLAVFARDGKQVRSFATGVFVPVSVKNFWLYSEKISFPSGGQVMMRFASYGTVSCNYLTTGTQVESSPTALDQAALLAL